jgi:quinol monooxygenase YgiN
MPVFAHATWIVKPGREDVFVRVWRELAEHTIERFPAARGTLLRDRAQANRFVSFGPWESVAQLEDWRASPAFDNAVVQARELLGSFDPGSFDLVGEAGGEA